MTASMISPSLIVWVPKDYAQGSCDLAFSTTTREMLPNIGFNVHLNLVRITQDLLFMHLQILL